MYKGQLLLSIATILVLTALSICQEPDLSWLRAYSAVPNEPLLSRLDSYSLEDLRRFRALLDSIRAMPAENEWEGLYVAGGPNEVGFSTLQFRLGSGFASLYIYTCTPELREINYGSVSSTEDLIDFVADVPANSPRKVGRIRLVKVRWGDRRYLVAEESLAAFAEKAVGVFVPNYDDDDEKQEWWNFWESGDFESQFIGRPQLPTRFRHLERSAIEAQITSVRPRRIVSEYSTGRSYHTAESALYRIAINAGSNQGVRSGLILKLDGTNDEITITQVGRTRSEGVIVRAINDITRADHCLTDDAKLIRCPQIRSGMKVSTVIGNFFY